MPRILVGMRRETAADEPIRGHIRQVGFRRVAHGLFLPVNDSADVGSEFLRDLRAWLLVLPAGAAFTHLTAARLLGWQLPPRIPEHVPIFAAVSQSDPRPRRPGLICSRLLRSQSPSMVAGVPVERSEEVLLRAARDLGLLDLTILVDSARHLGHVEAAAMRSILRSTRPGVRNLRRAWAMSSADAHSAGETILRLFDTTMEVDVRPQAELFDDAGNVVGLADLLVVGTRFVHEYDGAHHRARRQHRKDLRRDRGISGADYQRRGFTLDDLANHPATVMHEIDRDLGRPHRRSRLQQWRRLVDNSFLSERGRSRMMHRWQQQMGVTDWSGTA